MDSVPPNLAQIAETYDRAELTCVYAAQKKTTDYFNLLTLIELVPVEQQDSPPIGSAKYLYNILQSNDDFSFFIVRLPGISVNDAISHYQNAENGIQFTIYGKRIDVSVAALVQNPPDYHPLLIDTQTEKTIGRILPHRPTTCRVWSKLNVDKTWLEPFDSKFYTELSSVSLQYLGYDISKVREHIGNIYLFGCNPILRHWENALLDYNKDLLIRFRERTGKTIAGSRVILEERRAKNYGFYLDVPITSLNQRVALPYFPDELFTKIIDSNGNLIDFHVGRWTNFSIDFFAGGMTVNYKIKSKDGEEVYSIPKKEKAQTLKIGTYDLTTAYYLENAMRARHFEDLAASKELIFFPPHPDSREKAKQVVRELLNMAKRRCMILDPYFGAGDLVFAFQIENVSFPVQIITAAANLTKSPEDGKKRKKWAALLDCIRNVFGRQVKGKQKTYLDILRETIENYRKLFPQQKIECRVLSSRTSPLHDRYIIVDDDAYLLGSSLNHFGSRTTTMIKLPDPKELIDQAEKWWADDKGCPRIEEYFTNKTDEDVS